MISGRRLTAPPTAISSRAIDTFRSLSSPTLSQETTVESTVNGVTLARGLLALEIHGVCQSQADVSKCTAGNGVAAEGFFERLFAVCDSDAQIDELARSLLSMGFVVENPGSECREDGAYLGFRLIAEYRVSPKREVLRNRLVNRIRNPGNRSLAVAYIRERRSLLDGVRRIFGEATAGELHCRLSRYLSEQVDAYLEAEYYFDAATTLEATLPASNLLLGFMRSELERGNERFLATLIPLFVDEMADAENRGDFGLSDVAHYLQQRHGLPLSISLRLQENARAAEPLLIDLFALCSSKHNMLTECFDTMLSMCGGLDSLLLSLESKVYALSDGARETTKEHNVSVSAAAESCADLECGSRAIDEATRLGLPIGCSRTTGAMLRALAASKPDGNFLELGTGVGVSTTWITAGMVGQSRLLTVEWDPVTHSVAKRHLSDRRVTFLNRDITAVLNGLSEASFDFVYADAWPGKFADVDRVLALLKRGGVFVADDMSKQNHVDMFAVDQMKDELLCRLSSDDSIVTWFIDSGSGAVLAVKK